MPKNSKKKSIKMSINAEKLDAHIKSVCSKNINRNAKICTKCPFAEIIRRKITRKK